MIVLSEKRFEFQNQDHHLNMVYDNEKGKVVFNEDIVDLLNEQYEEIVELREAMKRLMGDLMTR